MEHVFIVNPAAGKKDATEAVAGYLKKNGSGIKYTIYVTKHQGDATSYVKKRCEETDEPLRFYACGGDGTLNEVVNGAYGYKNVAVGFFPCGSGNDFIKSFPEYRDFFSLENIIKGRTVPVDLIKLNNRLCINICHFGFDAAVAHNMVKFKNWPGVSGHSAYMLSVAHCLLYYVKHPCRIEVDDVEVFSGDILLAAIGNGKCYGGGFYCLPDAITNDGILEIVIVKKISRLRFAKLFKNYKTGAYLHLPEYKPYFQYLQGRHIKIIAKNKIIAGYDGESEKVSQADVSVISKAIDFIVP